MDGLVVKKSVKEGEGVFATKLFKVNDVLLKMVGEIKHYDDIELDSYDDYHCLQITEDTYMVSKPSPDKSDVDDFFNHSCEPNSGIKFVDGEYLLIVIKDISPGDEVTFDYSCWVDEVDWELKCHCGSSSCRGIVKSFKFLSDALKKKYLDLGVVLPHLLSH